MTISRIACALLLAVSFPHLTHAQSDAASRLVGALQGDTPLVSDLRTLTDQIGGRATGSPANLRAVEWAVQRFRDAGVEVRKEPFRMPGLWLGAIRIRRGERRGRELRSTGRGAAVLDPDSEGGTERSSG